MSPMNQEGQSFFFWLCDFLWLCDHARAQADDVFASNDFDKVSVATQQVIIG